MKKIVYPDYQNCITNIPNSVLKHYGVEPVGSTLPYLDQLLEKNFKNVVVLLLDGMGKMIIDHNLEENGFFRTNCKKVISSVFPSTTVAATTSIMSGQQPNEHSWLGWDCYFPQINKNVTVFRNTESETGLPAADYNVAGTYIPYEDIVDKLNSAGKKAYWATPYKEPCPETFENILERIKNLCAEEQPKYIYAYWNEPDHFMHRNGCRSEGSVQLLRELEQQVEEMAAELKDTLLIITADHGHMDSPGVSITDYPELFDCLERLPSIEPRALNLFIKEDRKEEFAQLFRKTFEGTFLLWSKEEVMEKKIFGEGTEDHPNFAGMLGDFLALAVDDLSIYNDSEKAATFLSVHAGLAEDEMLVPLIIVEK